MIYFQSIEKKFYQMGENEKSVANSKINNFLCGLHTLVHTTGVFSPYMKQKTQFNGDVPIQNSSYAKANQIDCNCLIFAVCTAFARFGIKDPRWLSRSLGY